MRTLAPAPSRLTAWRAYCPWGPQSKASRTHHHLHQQQHWQQGTRFSTCLPASPRPQVSPLRTHAEPVVLLSPLTGCPAPSIPPLGPWTATAALLAACALLLLAAASARFKPPSPQPSPDSLPQPPTPSFPDPTTPRSNSSQPPSHPDGPPHSPPPRPAPHSRQQQRAQALSRQAAHLSSALRLLRQGKDSKALDELARALQQNSICRTPCPEGAHDRDACMELYLLHVRSCEGTPSFTALLQIQEMLGLSPEEAEALELQVLNSSAPFCI